ILRNHPKGFNYFFMSSPGGGAGAELVLECFEDDRRNLLLAYQLIEIGQVGLDQFVPFRNLLIAALLEQVEDVIGLLRWSSIGAGNRPRQRDQLVVEANGIVQDILAALGFCLNERVLDRINFLRESFRRIAHRLPVIIFGQALVEIIDLLLHAGHLIDSLIDLAYLIVNLKQQIELLLQIGLFHFDTRIALDLERLGVRLAPYCQAYLIITWHSDRTAVASSPQNCTGSFGGILITKIPDKAIQSGIAGWIRLRLPHKSLAGFFAL